MRRLLAAIASLTLCSAAHAQQIPRGSDDVLLARVYRTTPAGTDALGRVGVILSGKPVTQALHVPASEGQPAMTFTITGQRKGDGARVAWELSDGASAKGTAEVHSGALNRVSLVEDGAREIFASFESGRASTFDVMKLSQHFGAMPWSMPAGSAATPASYAQPVAGAAAVVAPRSTKGPVMDLACPGGGHFELSLNEGRGECRRTQDSNGAVIGATCDDGAGNAAEVDCRIDPPRGGCLRVSGSGSCTQKR